MKGLPPSRWSGSDGRYPDSCCIQELFERQASRNPEAIAIESSDRSLSYGELDRKAGALAERLKKAGLGPEFRAGILADRTPELFVAILAVLKAGGCYLCLDPCYPQERLLQIWEDLRARVLIVSDAYKDRLPSFGAELVPLEKTLVELADGGTSAAGPSGSGFPDHLAYIIFTSGSTGRPKGILLQHRGLCNLVHVSNQLLGLGPGDRLLQFAALSFDVFVWETFMALSSGATLVLPGSVDRFLAAMLEQVLRQRRITVALLPPSLMTLMSPESLTDLRAVISVGERLPNEVVRRWAKGRRLINGYGPAEATITVSFFETQPEGEYAVQGPPIGKPIQNVRLYLLGSDRQPVPVGEPGEVFIGGIQTARGYLNRPELDQERFLADPFIGRSGARMYRTGDLARWRTDGHIEFLGRQDSQVKLRGIRIELGEIEAVLRSHPFVGEAVALIRQERPGRAQLVAFFSPSQENPPSRRDLRRHMEQSLPSYMVPEDYVMVRELPRTPNGKLDRDALLKENIHG
ncbi:MAG: amino acid adenylation domain-containing protein [Elusimicrobiota bacterium]